MDLKPAIVAPVARSTGIADRDRSVRFYRDVLGFEIHDAADTLEAVSGPARIQLCSEDYTPNDWTEPRRPGSAVIFFETDDVAAMHAAIRAHGGLPSEVEKVNWIKMRMFQIRDPDGHTLWFGQSYDKPHKARLSPMMLKALPELPFTDVAAAVAYYRDVLGFHVNYQQHDLGVMDRDAITMVLIARTDRQKGIGSAYVYIEDADALHTELREKGAHIQGEPVSHPWGLRDFGVVDLEGNRITFGQPFE
jgi:catechol 2,3-dioxygenase-like lactoylglutathione lyase family enzyme